MSVEKIKYLTFTRADDLLEGEQRLPLKTIHLNKCPAIVPLKTLTSENIKQWDINLAQCAQHLSELKTDQSLSDRIQEAFKSSYSPPSDDPDQNLYSGGFFSTNDKEKMKLIRDSKESELADLTFDFEDERLEEMLFRYRCRNYPDTLFMHEIERWNEYRIKRMASADGDASIKLSEYQQELHDLRLKQKAGDFPEETGTLLDQLDAYPALIGIKNLK